MKISFLVLLIMYSLPTLAARYVIEEGKLHKKGKAQISVLSNKEIYQVKMSYKLKSKDFIPVPKKFLEDEKIMEFPPAFRTIAGYQELETKRSMQIPKATLKFQRRGKHGNLQNAYFIEVLPSNKKSKIQIIYHPALPDTGWKQVKITMISSFPVLDGYKLVARLIDP